MALLEGKKAIVVGASSGLGYGTALRYAEEGADVIAGARRIKRLEALSAEARERGFAGRIIPVTCDVANEDDLDNLVAMAAEELGRIDILAAIAQGGLGHQTFLGETTKEDALNSYVTGPLYTMLLMQKVFPYMKDQGYGRIITCASGAAVSSTTGFTAYAMAKAAIMALTRKAAKEWGRLGIVTNCVMPVTTNDHFGQDAQSSAALKSIAEGSPVGYMGDPYEDASPILAFLASDGAHYLNSAIVGVDGGLQVYA